ncbi:HNH endonuclease [Cystobacter fuscus]|uniref:HNH endonuclease n=1 Tax=Cystobacter fuscus TaxID=43 RepID=UPI000971519A|nr:HNH endonuclease signature motif containing protein [Cystobacter fuscus]
MTQLGSAASDPSSFASKATKGGAGDSRTGKAFTPAGKKKIDAANATKNDGINKCENCGIEVVPGQKSQSGVSPPTNQRERDHVIPKSKGGEGTPENGQVLCRECNLEKSNKAP